MRKNALLFLACSLLTAASALAEFQPNFGLPGLNGEVNALAVFDDGSGPALYAGGDFGRADGQLTSHLARWDGAAWSSVAGPAGEGVAGEVRALAVYDDGSGPALYVAGSFFMAGGIPATGIAKWNGTTWSSLGNASRVRSLAVFDDGSGEKLYAGGDFSAVGGVAADNIASWDGATWAPLLDGPFNGVSGPVEALRVYDDGSGEKLFVGGAFDTAGPLVANSIARWDGSSWSALAGPADVGVDRDVYSMAVFDDGSGEKLFVAGDFASAGGVAADFMARWDGGSWSPAGSGPGHVALSMVVHDDGSGAKLYAGGIVTLSTWDGASWSAAATTGALSTGVAALAVFDEGSGPSLFAGGDMDFLGGEVAHGIGRLDGGTWSSVSAGRLGASHQVWAFETYDDGSGEALFAGGIFLTIGGVLAPHVAKLQGGVWSPLTDPNGSGPSPAIFELQEYDDGAGSKLYAAGDFMNAGGTAVFNITSWDGTSWAPLAGGLGSDVHALAVFDDGTGARLYAGGQFTEADIVNGGGLVQVNHVASWDGSAWSPLLGSSTGVDDFVWALETFDDGSGEALYVAGDFTTAGGVPATRIARWDGSSWSSLTGPGTGTNGRINALEVFDDGSGEALYAGGLFTEAGGTAASRVAKWDGTSWSAVGGPGADGVGFSRVNALLATDAGDGPALYVTGDFTTAGGAPASRIARWNGTEWQAVTGPVDNGLAGTSSPFGATLAAHDDGGGNAVYVGGVFSAAGGLAASFLAKWQVTPLLFENGFESGDTSQWSATVP